SRLTRRLQLCLQAPDLIVAQRERLHAEVRFVRGASTGREPGEAVAVALPVDAVVGRHHVLQHVHPGVRPVNVESGTTYLGLRDTEVPCQPLDLRRRLLGAVLTVADERRETLRLLLRLLRSLLRGLLPVDGGVGAVVLVPEKLVQTRDLLTHPVGDGLPVSAVACIFGQLSVRRASLVHLLAEPDAVALQPAHSLVTHPPTSPTVGPSMSHASGEAACRDPPASRRPGAARRRRGGRLLGGRPRRRA